MGRMQCGNSHGGETVEHGSHGNNKLDSTEQSGKYKVENAAEV